MKAQEAEIKELRRRSATPQSESASSDISPVNQRFRFNRLSPSDSYQRSSDRDDREMDNPDDIVCNTISIYVNIMYWLTCSYLHVTIYRAVYWYAVTPLID